MGPLTTTDSVPVTLGAVPTLSRCVVVSRGRKGSADPSPRPPPRHPPGHRRPVHRRRAGL